MAGLLEPPVAEKLFTVAEFVTMMEAGLFADVEGKVELADGRVIVTPPDGPRHISVAHRLTKHWVPRIEADPSLGGRVGFYSPGAVRLNKRSVRAPDALLCPPGIYEGDRWPDAHEVLLCVEHSDTTLRNDDGPKRAAHARAGVRELWIVRVPKRDVRVCRDPRPDGSWGEAALHGTDATIAPLCAAELAIAVRDLFE